MRQPVSPCCLVLLGKMLNFVTGFIVKKHAPNFHKNSHHTLDYIFERGDASFTSLVVFILYDDITTCISKRSALTKAAIKHRENRDYHFLAAVC